MAENKNTRLGTGLGALFGDDTPEEENSSSVQTLPINKIEPRKDQPRKQFDEEAIAALSESIKEYGLIQPITVRQLQNGYYQIIAGERRWRASRQAGLTEVPVRIIEADDRLAMEMALVENLQREDLNPIEEALGYQKLMDEYGMTQEVVANRVQKSRSAVANALRLLGLDKSTQKKVSDGELSAGHARAVLSVADASERKAVVEEIISKGLSVRQAEALASSKQKEKKASSKQKKTGAVNYAKEASKHLSDVMGRQVRLVGGNDRGTICLDFYSADDRESLMDALTHMNMPWRNTEKKGE